MISFLPYLFCNFFFTIFPQCFPMYLFHLLRNSANPPITSLHHFPASYLFQFLLLPFNLFPTFRTRSSQNSNSPVVFHNLCSRLGTECQQGRADSNDMPWCYCIFTSGVFWPKNDRANLCRPRNYYDKWAPTLHYNRCPAFRDGRYSVDVFGAHILDQRFSQAYPYLFIADNQGPASLDDIFKSTVYAYGSQ